MRSLQTMAKKWFSLQECSISQSELPFLLGDPEVTANIYCKSRNLPKRYTQNYRFAVISVSPSMNSPCKMCTFSFTHRNTNILNSKIINFGLFSANITREKNISKIECRIRCFLKGRIWIF